MVTVALLTVMRWPMCDCRDNPYQQLLAAVLPERGFVCFGSRGVRTSSPRLNTLSD